VEIAIRGALDHSGLYGVRFLNVGIIVAVYGISARKNSLAKDSENEKKTRDVEIKYEVRALQSLRPSSGIVYCTSIDPKIGFRQNKESPQMSDENTKAKLGGKLHYEVNGGDMLDAAAKIPANGVFREWAVKNSHNSMLFLRVLDPFPSFRESLTSCRD
jgi:hypothetical protein